MEKEIIMEMVEKIIMEMVEKIIMEMKKKNLFIDGNYLFLASKNF